MRVITGKYKGRRFEIPRTFKARPTTDFAKENLFNVLICGFRRMRRARFVCRNGQHYARTALTRLPQRDVGGTRPRTLCVHIVGNAQARRRELQVVARRRAALHIALPRTLRHNICRPALCAARAEGYSRPRDECAFAQRRGCVRARARQDAGFLFTSVFC